MGGVSRSPHAELRKGLSMGESEGVPSSGVRPLTLNNVKGLSGGRPGLHQPVAPTTLATPDSPVIPKPREESGAGPLP